MPLLYQTHRPPPVLAEFRNLYRQIDRLRGDVAAISPTTVVITGGDGEPAVGGMIHAWTKKVDIRLMNPVVGWNTQEWTVAQINAESYTHLDLHVLIQRTSTSLESQRPLKYRWRVAGENPFYLSIWSSTPPYAPDWELYDQVPSVQYWWEMGGTGRFRPVPRFTETIYPWQSHDWSTWVHDLAYKPVAPQGGVDTLKLWWGYDLPEGDEGRECVTCKAWFVGRYVVHDKVQWGELCPVL